MWAENYKFGSISIPKSVKPSLWSKGVRLCNKQCFDQGKLLLSSLPVSPSRVCAPGTSLYHLVPKHLRATWPRPEQSHLLPDACFPNGTDNRQQRQRQTERPPPEPSDFLKRFYALYDIKWRYFMKKVSKLYYMFNPLLHMLPIGNRWFQLKLQNNSCNRGLMNAFFSKIINNVEERARERVI